MKIKFLISLLISATLWSCENQVFEKYKANVPTYISYEDLRSSIQILDASELQNPGKIYFYNDYLYINEYLKGIHIIDNSDPTNPENIAFISIPGNVDNAIKNDILYADSYVDIVALDISDLQNITEVDRLKDIIPYTLPPYDDNYRVDEVDRDKGIVIAWEIEDVEKEVTSPNYPIYLDYSLESTMINSSSSYSSGASSFGIGGSMARFTIYENYLYTIDNSSLNIIDISNYNNIIKTSTSYLGWNIETIFPHGDNLFIGSQNGMLIYDVSDPINPVKLSQYSHITNCDPVVVNDTLAYVTLRSGNNCGGTTNRLDVINISDLTLPTLLKTYGMTNPHGLGIDSTTLFICDGDDGLKIYNTSNPLDISSNIITSFEEINAFDVIPLNGVLMLIGENGLYQYDYSNLENIELLSTININN
ncbi:MAG: hypothetical protein PF487_08105 [Bacteroidales bacterium]|jgi:hypothetical protein|nr:hypothetical protein [Bacteroidales bacterium]